MDRKFDLPATVPIPDVCPARSYTGEVPRVLDPFPFLLIAVSGWMNQHQRQMIDYLLEKNRVLREQLGDRRLRFTDDQRRMARILKGDSLGPQITLVTAA